MDSSIQIKILAEVPLTLACVKGRITPDIPLKFIERLSKTKGFDPNVDVLFDFRQANLDMDMLDLKEVAGRFMKHPAYYGNRKEVYVVKHQKELAKLSMFSIHARSNRIEFNVENSLRSALTYLGVKATHFEIIKSALDSMLQE